ncbi:MAG: putative oxidoreductase [Candidatus Hydrogenedentota bacterium]
MSIGALASVTQRTWDLLVVGAGPAGCAAAIQSARAGIDVLLVDKAAFPRWKVCGCCINQNAQQSLIVLGAESLLDDCRACHVDRLELRAAGQRANVRLPGYRVLSREVLDESLSEKACRSGAVFLPSTSATMIQSEREHRVVRLTRDAEIVSVRARIVVAADGLGGRLLHTIDAIDSAPYPSSRIGAAATIEPLPDWYEPGVIHMACGGGGYVGITSDERQRGAVGAAFDVRFVKEQGGLAAAARAVLREAGHADAEWACSVQWRGTPELTRRVTRLSAHRAFVVGDAAGYVEPFTGQGMSWALASGTAVAQFVLRGVRQFDPRLQREWAQTYRRVISKRLWPCRAISIALRHPTWISHSIRILDTVPLAAWPVVHHINKAVR